KGEGGIPVLRKLGIFDTLRPDMSPVSNFIFCDQHGTPLLELAASTDDKNMTVRVQRRRLKAALRAAAPDVELRYGMEATGYRQTEEAIEVQFRNGQTIKADYVVAADGVGSALRQQLVGDKKRYLGLTCIVGSAPIEVQHPLLAGGYFL